MKMKSTVRGMVNVFYLILFQKYQKQSWDRTKVDYRHRSKRFFQRSQRELGPLNYRIFHSGRRWRVIVFVCPFNQFEFDARRLRSDRGFRTTAEKCVVPAQRRPTVGIVLGRG